MDVFRRGFAAHHHKDAEIVTYVVEGELTHHDSMGAKETLGRGSIQYMTAGSGVVHSEHNMQENKPMRVIQMWLQPKSKGLMPKYGSVKGESVKTNGGWAHVVSSCHTDAKVPVRICSEVNIVWQQSLFY